jgi:hypothetical protein
LWVDLLVLFVVFLISKLVILEFNILHSYLSSFFNK